MARASSEGRIQGPGRPPPGPAVGSSAASSGAARIAAMAPPPGPGAAAAPAPGCWVGGPPRICSPPCVKHRGEKKDTDTATGRA